MAKERIVVAVGVMPRARARFVRRLPFLVQYRPVDWSAVINDLMGENYSQVIIAQQLACGKTAVWRWYNEQMSPGHDNGEQLLTLWKFVTGKTDADIPRR